MNSRGKNFTEREKCKLLELVQKYKHIIENKCTNAVTTIKKNETWEAIAVDFNNTAEVQRTQKQLYTAYLNLKRTSRQNKSLMAKNGALLKSELNNSSAQISDLGGEQVQPLTNNCDSATSYYQNDETVTTCEVMITKLEPPFDDVPSDMETSCDALPPNLEPQISITSDTNHQTCKPLVNKKNAEEKNKVNNKNNILKAEYYQKKLESAVLEKKIKILEYNMMLKRQKLLDMEIKIKEKEYENLMNK